MDKVEGLMSHFSKLSFLSAGFSLIILSGARFVLGAWHPILYIFLALFILSLIASLVFDYKLYLQILSIKTAQKGLSLGWSLVLLIVFLGAFSYFGKRFDKTFDFTSEKLNSLSEQSQTALQNIKSPLIFYIFYKGDKIQDQIRAVQQELKAVLGLYKQENSKVQLVFVDAYKQPLKAEEYLSDLHDKEQESLFVFVSYEDRKIRVSIPFQEEQLTSAVIQAQKREFKEILFLTGHGERKLESEEPGGLKALNQSLKDSGFTLKEWSFLQQGAPKSPPALTAVIGPRQNFIDLEKQWLKDYLSKGGRLFLALDPKESHNLTDFLKDYGLIYKDDFVLSQLSLLYRSNLLTAFGLSFDPQHPITQKLSPQRPAVFDRASSLELDSKFLDRFEYSFIVRTGEKSLSAPKLEKAEVLLKKLVQPSNLGIFNLALLVQAKNKEQEKEEKKEDKLFKLAVFGDSDFLSNAGFATGSNKDLALNSFVYLAGEEELVSIRPKQPKGTKINLKSYQEMILILAYIALPLIFLITGLFIWYNRRSS